MWLKGEADLPSRGAPSPPLEHPFPPQPALAVNGRKLAVLEDEGFPIRHRLARTIAMVDAAPFRSADHKRETDEVRGQGRLIVFGSSRRDWQRLTHLI